ncbi:MAG: OmpA family protein [Bacteroidota bacterium]|jgi:chemotaxis protein MotB|nr:OmpA family protein [Cytophagales bacterium]MCE2956384.1 OmpA family protein [Flammeovirgaceae bacterium]MCZ8071366.1 OmpA family protein [Cytophagales bacterium]
MNKVFFIVVSMVLLSSCVVSKKKFDDMLAQKIKAEGDLVDKNKELDKANASLNELNESIKKMQQDTANLNATYRANQKKLSSLNQEYSQLNANYKNLLTNSGKLNRDISQQRDQLLAIQENLDKTRRENDSLSTSLQEREKKVKELEQVLANKDKAVQSLKNKISNALLNFKENDLTVKVKNGKVYVSLSEQLLFASGSIVVDKKGEGALQQLAKALKDQKDIQMMIEGHTDNVPISKKSTYMEDNWDLSVLRATSISKILIDAGMSPKQITAAGKGEFSPLAANDNAANKQKNRRTEIIVTPNLDELFKILDAN